MGKIFYEKRNIKITNFWFSLNEGEYLVNTEGIHNMTYLRSIFNEGDAKFDVWKEVQKPEPRNDMKGRKDERDDSEEDRGRNQTNTHPGYPLIATLWEKNKKNH